MSTQLSRRDRWRVPLEACCEATRARLRPVANLSRRFPWIDASPPEMAAYVRNEGGFEVEAWDGSVAATSWLYLNDHILRRRPLTGWSDLLHAVTAPCVVVENPQKGWGGEPRLALFRLRPGTEATFRFAVVQREEPGDLRIITAYQKHCFVNGHYQALVDKRHATCAGFALRRRDLHRYPDGFGIGVPARWSSAAQTPPPECCELKPGCFYKPGAVPAPQD